MVGPLPVKEITSSAPSKMPLGSISNSVISTSPNSFTSPAGVATLTGPASSVNVTSLSRSVSVAVAAEFRSITGEKRTSMVEVAGALVLPPLSVSVNASVRSPPPGLASEFS